MKKILCMIMAVIMILSMVACGNQTDKPTEPQNPTVNENPTETPDTDVTEPEGGDDVIIDAPASVATQVVDAFNAVLAEPGAGDYNLEEIANKLAQSAILADTYPSIGAMQTEVGPTYLAGFNEEIGGYKAAYAVAPMIGTIPFVSYVFELEADADANAFVDTLTAQHNLRWNICTAADEMQCIINGNYVFFVMAPLSVEQDAPAEGGDDVVVPDEPVVDENTPAAPEGDTPAEGTDTPAEGTEAAESTDAAADENAEG